MTTHANSPQRLYLIQVAGGAMPVPCYLVQTSQGQNILIDSGLPKGLQPPAGMGIPPFEHGLDVVEQLALLGLQPEDIHLLVCTHFDVDHAGNHARFPHAELLVQRRHYELARDGHPRFAPIRASWDHPNLHYHLLDGDTELLPGFDLIVTDGHTLGHQSVLLRLPETGLVLLTIDAVPAQSFFRPDRPKHPLDDDEELARAGAQKLLGLVEHFGPVLVIFGHDLAQWQTLNKLPAVYQ